MTRSLPITIALPQGFLAPEEKCGTHLDVTQKRVFAIQLDLLNRLLEVCRKNDITISVFAGTLLGAVRHKGFIPWDDDVDVCMDRKNFERLRKLPPDAFPAPYFLQTCFSDKMFFCPYARLRNGNTTGAIVGEDYVGYNNGIYIDIFVLDGYSYRPWFVWLQRKARSFCVECIASVSKRPGISHGMAVHVIHAFSFLWRRIGYDWLIRIYDRIVSAATGSSNRITMMTHDDFFVKRYWLKKDELQDLIMLPFENIMVPLPRAYDTVLKRIYGDYSQFPPVEKRGAWHENQLLVNPNVPYKVYLSSNTSMRKVWFVTFADSRMKQPLRRIRRQAMEMGFSQDRILAMTEKDLGDDFKEKMSSHLVKGSRGYGYWCWRPNVVLQALRKMEEGEILLYTDAGCHLNPHGLPRLREYLKMVDEAELLAFQGRSLLGTAKYDPLHHFNHIGQWTKGDVLDYFGVRENVEVLKSGQYSGGVFLVKKTKRSVAFYERYQAIAENHFSFFDDTPSKTRNTPEFREHRHDQAVFTLLCMKEGVKTLSTCEYGVYAQLAPEQYRNDPSWSCRSFDEMSRFPVHARRDTTYGWRYYVPRRLRRAGLSMIDSAQKIGEAMPRLKMRFLSTTLGSAMYARFVVPHYHTYVRYDTGDEHRVELPDCELDREFVADPFLIEQGGTNWLFFEGLKKDRGHRGRSKGVIGCFRQDGDAWEYVGVVLEAETHLSYPQVFAVDGRVYMIPESGQAGEVSLYEAIEFPKKWKKRATLIEGKFVDSSIVKCGDKFFIVTAPEDASMPPEVWVSSRLDGGWKKHPQCGNVLSSPRFRRNGGSICRFDGQLFRIAQDCDAGYGKRLYRIPIDRISAVEYAEGEPELLSDAVSWHQSELHHTYNMLLGTGRKVEVVDRHFNTLKGPFCFLVSAIWFVWDGACHVAQRIFPFMVSNEDRI